MTRENWARMEVMHLLLLWFHSCLVHFVPDFGCWENKIM